MKEFPVTKLIFIVSKYHVDEFKLPILITIKPSKKKAKDYKLQQKQRIQFAIPLGMHQYYLNYNSLAQDFFNKEQKTHDFRVGGRPEEGEYILSEDPSIPDYSHSYNYGGWNNSFIRVLFSNSALDKDVLKLSKLPSELLDSKTLDTIIKDKYYMDFDVFGNALAPLSIDPIVGTLVFDFLRLLKRAYGGGYTKKQKEAWNFILKNQLYIQNSQLWIKDLIEKFPTILNFREQDLLKMDKQYLLFLEMQLDFLELRKNVTQLGAYFLYNKRYTIQNNKTWNVPFVFKYANLGYALEKFPKQPSKFLDSLLNYAKRLPKLRKTGHKLYRLPEYGNLLYRIGDSYLPLLGIVTCAHIRQNIYDLYQRGAIQYYTENWRKWFGEHGATFWYRRQRRNRIPYGIRIDYYLELKKLKKTLIGGLKLKENSLEGDKLSLEQRHKYSQIIVSAIDYRDVEFDTWGE